MKLNVIFIKGKFLIFILCFSFIILFVSLNRFYKRSHDSIPTIAKPQIEEYLKHDLNGDNKDDLLYISCRNNIYYMEAYINDKTYFFNPQSQLNTLGNYNESWPLSVKLIDLNNDNTPEVITSGFFNNSSAIHIFTLSNNEFKDIFWSTNNFIGILNFSDLNYPTLISSSINNFSNNLESYILKDNLLKKVSIDDFSLQSLDIVKTIISFIESEENQYTSFSNLFSDNIASFGISLLYNLKKDNLKYTFQNCFLEAPTPSSNNYTLAFKKYDEYESNQLILNIDINKIDNTFLITSIK